MTRVGAVVVACSAAGAVLSAALDWATVQSPPAHVAVDGWGHGGAWAIAATAVVCLCLARDIHRIGAVVGFVAILHLIYVGSSLPTTLLAQFGGRVELAAGWYAAAAGTGVAFLYACGRTLGVALDATPQAPRD